jgi:hypothetical protein
MLENNVVRKICGPKRGDSIELKNEYSSPSTEGLHEEEIQYA